MANVPGFVKFFPDRSSERLPLPVAYSQILGSSTPGVASLRNSDGQMWQVTLAKEGDTWYFQDGWKDLVKTINAEARDLFTFDYADDAIFHFKLFGANRCNKPTSWGQREQEVENNEEEVGEEEDTGQEESGGGQKKQEHRDKDKSVIEEEDPEEEIGYLADKVAEPTMRKEGCKNKGKSAIEVPDAPPTSVLEVNDEPKRRRYYRQRKSKSDEEEIFQHGVISRPGNPHFIGKILEWKPSDLCIPREVVDKHNLQLPKNIVLVDERNRRWEAEVRHLEDGRIRISQGWKAFCRVNHMRLEDRCLCEFIQGEGQQEPYLKIRILRGGSWLPEATREA